MLSADNAIPERHIVIETIRKAAPLLGLKAQVIATLDAMLSCLPPRRNHHTVFASNATLTFRRNGISDRTIRRHAATLQEIGLLTRKDSANKKRFTRHNTAEGLSLRFGFDLTPLFDRFHEIAALAAKAMQEREEIAYLRTKIRARANEMLQENADHAQATNALRILRRKLTLADCNTLLQALAQCPTIKDSASVDAAMEPAEMTANDGQNVRHHHKSNKEHIDEEQMQRGKQLTKIETDLTVSEVVAACPEAVQFSLTAIETETDVINHARALAPMIGIDERTYQTAQKHIGPMGAALTVWAIMQFHQKVKSVGAYFRALTSGSKSAAFDPAQLIKRLSNGRGQRAWV